MKAIEGLAIFWISISLYFAIDWLYNRYKRKKV